MKNFFENCTSAENCKDVYKKLYAYHYSSAENMAEINQQLKNRLHDLQQPANETTQQAPAAAPVPISDAILEAAGYAKTLPGVTVEINGQWVWVTGQTKQHKENLGKYGFHFSWKKEAWFFHTMKGFRSRNRLSLPQIREKYTPQPEPTDTK